MKDTTQPRALSPSQLGIFEECERKWGFRYFSDEEGRRSRFAELGTRVHARLEEWLSKGVPLDETTEEGRIALAGIKHLPAPSSALKVEQAIEFSRPDKRIRYKGFVDLWYIRNRRLIVTDHKTTVNFKWAKTTEDLEQRDKQAPIYAMGAMIQAGMREADLEWIYYRTRGANKSKRVQAHFTMKQADARLQEMDKIALKIYERRAIPDLKPHDLPVNVKSCDLFGGCPFREACGLGAKERIASLMAKESMADKMKAKMEAAKAAKQINAPESEPDNTDTTTTAKESTGGGLSALDKLKARQKKKSAPETEEAPKEETKKKATGGSSSKKTGGGGSKGKKAAPKATGGNLGGFVLYVDCYPLKHSRPESVHVAFSDVLDELADTTGEPHHKLVEYGKGTALLEAAIAQAIHEGRFTGDLYLDSRSSLGRDLLGVLQEHAAQVIRSMI